MEGCINDDLIFIGGKTELIKHYCSRFSTSDYCINLVSRYNTSNTDKLFKMLGDNPEKSDVLINDFTKIFEE